MVDSAQNCEGAVPLSEVEKISAFYSAVSEAEPDIIKTNFIYKEEADRNKKQNYNKNKDDSIKAHSEYTRQIPIKQRNKCTRCAKYGHKDDGSCPLEPLGQWFCYCCGKVATHKGRYECPTIKNSNSSNRHNRGNGSRSYDSNNSSYNNKYQRNYGNSYEGRNGGGKVNNHKQQRQRRQEQKLYDEKKQNKSAGANQTGNILNSYNSSNNITFIADSGATEHIINKDIILTNFEKCKGQYIKCANKNKKADITIDGKGNLYLQENSESNQTIELTNVLAAKGIANNLISLRRFADAGLSIYLDNKVLKIFDKDSNHEYITGIYQKPNWLITLSVKQKQSTHQNNYDSYKYTAQIVSLEDLLNQSQIDVNDLSMQN